MKRFNVVTSIIIVTLCFFFLSSKTTYAEENEQIESDQVESETTEIEYKEHKVAVKISKIDEENNQLKGATLQVLDKDNNVVDEWVSDGTIHEIMLPEGEYTLHEVEAPEGYEIAEDQVFTVDAIINEINAGTDHDQEICDHYGGIPLYYVEVESQGTKQKQEVYCINQGWDEPHEINYDGTVVTVDNITSFVPDYDKTMNNQDLYDKVLDIIYHRSKAHEAFPTLSEVEIRYITEYALKNYTSTDYESPNGKDSNGNYIMSKIFRDYTYDETVNSKYRQTPGEGDAIGNLAKHWWVYHKENGKRVAMPSIYADLFYYLIRDDENERHPSDMHLYVYSTNMKTSDNENYQNLLGITWFNPYDDSHIVEVSLEDKYSRETTDITITKMWEDDEDRDGIRPDSIEVTLSNGTKVTLNEENKWSATIENLPVYDKGQKIEYTWSEASVEGYEQIGNKTEGYVTTLTNKHTPETVSLTITKTWDDFDDVAKLRPEEITVNLIANDVLLKSYIIKNTDNWEITITGLNKYENGVEIIYTITEKEIFEYETTIEKTGDGFNIINHHELGKGNGPEEEPPQTGVELTTRSKNNYNLLLILFNLTALAFASKRKEI